jgi:hypothetical protein
VELAGQAGESYLDDAQRTTQSNGDSRGAGVTLARMRIGRGHSQPGHGHGLDAAPGADWTGLRTGRALDPETVAARMRTVFGLDAVADWTRPRPAGRTMARTSCVRTATTARTQNPSLAKE